MPAQADELGIIPDIEIVIALLPEVFGRADQAPRHSLLQRFERIGERAALGIAREQVNMLRHDYVGVDAKAKAARDTLQRGLEDSLCRLTCLFAERFVGPAFGFEDGRFGGFGFGWLYSFL